VEWRRWHIPSLLFKVWQ